MFSISSILKRSWRVLLDYKILWVFGLLIALAGGASSGGGNGFRYTFDHNNGKVQNFNGFLPQWFNQQPGRWLDRNFSGWFSTPEQTFNTILLIVLIFVGLCVLATLLLALVRYPAETAVIRMVDDHAATGTKMTFKQGWKSGWNRRAFNIWLIDLILSLPGILFGIGIAAWVITTVRTALFSGSVQPNWALVSGWILVIIFLLLPISLLEIFLRIWRQYAVRYAAVDGLPLGESFAQGWKLLLKHFGHTLLTWIVLVGIGILAGIALSLAFFLLIPTYVVMAIPGAIAAAVTGGIGFGITMIFNSVVWPWVIGALAALPIFLMIVFSPLSFVTGLVQVFTSSTWTLAFRDLRTAQPPSQLPLPVPPALPSENQGAAN